MRPRTAIAVVSTLLLLPSAVASDAAAKAATVSGKVPGGAPAVNGRVVSTVAVANPATARYLAAGFLARSGRYSVRVPPGPVVVLARVVPGSGRPKVSSSRVARVKSGQRKRVKVTKKRPRPRRRRPKARSSQGATKLVKVSTFGSTVADSVPGADARALEGMMVHEVFTAGERAPCDVELYADRESDDFRAIQAEVQLQQSPLFDPGTRVTPRYNTPRHTPNTRIQAHLKLGPDGNSVTGQVVAKKRSGRTISRSVSGGWGEFFFSGNDTNNAFDKALDSLFRELCGEGITEISGTFSGNTTTPPGPDYRWTGSVVFTRPPGDPDAPFYVSSGTVNYIASGRSPSGECEASGSQQYDLPPGGGAITVFGTPPDNAAPFTYYISVPPPFPATMEITRSNCSDPSQNGTQTVGVGGSPIDTGLAAQISNDGVTFQGSYSNPGTGTLVNYNWSLTGD